MDKNILRDITYGMYLVTSKGIKMSGCIINTLIQITSESPIISISLNKNNFTNQIIKENKKFAISILSEEINNDIIGTFGFKSSKDVDKFSNIDYETIDDLPIITKDMCGYIIAEVINIVDCETHELFIARIKNMKKLNNNKAMTYKYYHEVIKGKAPKNAPTYIEEEKREIKDNIRKNIYVCNLCGYEHECDGELPDDFICPLCGADKSMFTQKED